MHRNIEVAVPTHLTPIILQSLLHNPNVINVVINEKASLKPVGDSLSLFVLNKGADEVLKIIAKNTQGEEYTVTTSEVASLNDPVHQEKIDQDVDEAIWEEMETGLRHNGRLTENFCTLMFVGGIIAAVCLVSDMPDLIFAFIAASIIAPGLEPLAKIPLGIVLGNKSVLTTGLKASVVGYSLLILAAGLSFWIMQEFGTVTKEDFLQNKVTQGLMKFKVAHFLLSLAAATASIIMYLSYRRNVIAGPLIALIFIPAAAAMGIALYLQEWGYILQFLKRLLIDVSIFLGVGVILISYKQKVVHKRKPIR
tara:strand:- start:43 stop:969 length:927 start_codon:yes stop_codon:yes gene_type:complete